MKNTFLMKRILVIATLAVASHFAVDAFLWHKAVDPRCVSQGLWDFSNIDTEQVTNISFNTIGCNLIAETLDGRRYWGRYDYEYNSRGFLSRANYSSEVSDSINFSTYYTYYTYNSRGCLTTLYRKGGIDRLPDGTEVFGDLDNIRYTNQGLVPVKMRVRTEAQVFAGRSGIGMDIDADLEYDAAGHLISDPTRGIFLIEYDGRDHPIRTYFDDGHVHYDSYDGLGNHISTTFYEAVGTVVAGHKPSRLRRIARRTYTGDGHILVNDSLQISAFTGGYFDRCGDTHYYINNYRGDIVAIADASGVIEQHNDYYPYGELWRRSGGHPFSFEGKERVDNDGRAELNYGARRYVPAACYFSSPDIAAEDMPFLSSYTFCAANPINIIDPSGNRIIVVQHDEAKVELSYDYTNNEFYANGTYTDSYIDDVVNNINIINQGEVGHGLAKILYNASKIIPIKDLETKYKAAYNYAEDYIQWNTYDILITQYQEGSQRLYERKIALYYVTLAHEMFHAVDDLLGTFDTNPWYYSVYNKKCISIIKNCEKFAVIGENYIRAEHNLPLRAAYGNPGSSKLSPGIVHYPLSNYYSDNKRSAFVINLLHKFQTTR